MLHVTAAERKTLLAAGAAAGMAATFGSPVSAVLLAVELLLFEFRPRSLIPVALAAAAATGVRIGLRRRRAGLRRCRTCAQPGGGALAAYMLLGALVGVAVRRASRAPSTASRTRFEKLPIHWMWWPALGGLAVGVVGYFAPRTLGVGYDNIEDIVSGELVGEALLVCAC